MSNEALTELIEFLLDEATNFQKQADVVRPHLEVGQHAAYLCGQCDGIAHGMEVAAAKLKKMIEG